MSIDNYTKCLLTGILVCLLLLTAKQYNIIADAEAQAFKPRALSANQVIDVNIVSINNKSLDHSDTVLPVNVEFMSGLPLPNFISNPGGQSHPLVPVAMRKRDGTWYMPTTFDHRLRVKATP